MTKLAGKTALVTGAASGIGKATAERFAAEGARVIVNDVSASGREAAESIGGAFILADLADADQTRALAEQAIRVHGGVDILVNNAGMQHVSPIEAFPDEEWERMLRIMLTAPFLLTKRLLPGMAERGWGRIVNMSSVHGLIASPNKSAYIAAKHGIVGLTKAAAVEAGPRGVTVNAVCPSFVRTPLVENQLPDLARASGVALEDVVEQVVLAQASVKRLIEPEEIAELVLFLASDAASAITGSAYPIDLAWTAR